MLTPDERFLFTTNFYFEYISRIDLKGQRTPVPIRVIAEEKSPDDGWRWGSGLALTPDGKKLIVPMGRDGRPDGTTAPNDQVAIVDVSRLTHRLLREVPLGGEPTHYGIGLTDDSRFAYIITSPRPVSDDPKLYEIGLQPPYRVRTLSVPAGSLTGAVVSNSLGKLFISDAAHRKIWVIDLATFPSHPPKEFFHINGHAPSTLLMDEEKNVLVVLSSQSRSVHFLDARDGRVLDSVEGLKEGSGALAFSPDRKWLIVPTNKGVAAIRVPTFAPRIVFSSDRGGGTYQLHTMRVDGTDMKPVFSRSIPAHDVMPRWSPDGRRIAFFTNRGIHPHVCVTDRDGSNLVVLDKTWPLMRGGGISCHPHDWSPDGRRIAFVPNSETEINIVDVETGEVAVVGAEFPGPYKHLNGLCWAPDGTIIAAVQRPGWGQDRDLFRVDPSTGAMIQITNELGKMENSFAPAVTPNGQIACLRALVLDSYKPQLYLVHEQPQGWATFEKIAHSGEDTVQANWPRWFPDSKQIAYTARSPGSEHVHLFVDDIKTGSTRQLTRGEWNDLFPDVSVPLRTVQ